MISFSYCISKRLPYLCFLYIVFLSIKFQVDTIFHTLKILLCCFLPYAVSEMCYHLYFYFYFFTQHVFLLWLLLRFSLIPSFKQFDYDMPGCNFFIILRLWVEFLGSKTFLIIISSRIFCLPPQFEKSSCILTIGC